MIFKYNYENIGKRIRTLRESKGWSQTELIEKLRDHYGSISRNKLSDIENGDYKDFKFSFVTAMCEIFGCDTGYLLCEYDERVRSSQDIHDMIGLSDLAISRLKAWYEDNNDLTEIVNYILEHPDSRVLLSKIESYCLKAEIFDGMRGHIHHATDVRDASDLLTATRYSAIETFGQILNGIYNQDHSEQRDYKKILENARGF